MIICPGTAAKGLVSTLPGSNGGDNGGYTIFGGLGVKGLEVKGLGFGVWCSGFGVLELGFGIVQILPHRVDVAGCTKTMGSLFRTKEG